jgi:hypothetical protein
MKKEIFKYIPIYILGIFIIVFILFARNSSDDKDGSTKKELNELYKQYDEGLLKAFLSIEELRPFSIIQFDKFSDKYKNEWTSPSKMIEKLNKHDRELLINRVADYLDRQGEQKNKSGIINKLKYWCIADEQFNILTEKMCLPDDIVFKALSEVAGTRNIFTQEKDDKLKDINNLNSLQVEQLYIETMNYISTLSLKEQLRCYGEVYSQLSVLTLK